MKNHINGRQMFTEIRLTNFKSYRKRTRISLAPLTVLIGANNAGKSSILQALLLLKQTLDDRGSNAALVTQGQIDAGGFLDMVHRSPKGAPAQDKPEFEIGASRSTERTFPVSKDRMLTYATALDIAFGFQKKANEIYVSRVALSADDGMRFQYANNKWSSPLIPQELSSDIEVRLKHFLPTWGQFAGPMGKPVQGFFHILILLMEMEPQSWYELFENLHNIPPTRVRIPFISTASRRASSDFGPGGENLLMALANTERIEKSKTLCDLVGEWLAKQFKIITNLRVRKFGPNESVYALIADDAHGRDEINVAGMGEGISQMLPILARVLSVPKDSCLLIEQPELHLHPAAQADMADLFIDRVLLGRQVVLETHSEHMLLRIRRRIAEGKLDPAKVSIVFIQKDDGESTARRLDLNDKGHFHAWPKGFFGDAYNEAMSLAMAIRTT